VHPAIDPTAATTDPSAAATNNERAFIRRPPFDEGRPRSTQPRATISITPEARAVVRARGHIRAPRRQRPQAKAPDSTVQRPSGGGRRQDSCAHWTRFSQAKSRQGVMRPRPKSRHGPLRSRDVHRRCGGAA
jgi:hypothetical protein